MTFLLHFICEEWCKRTLKKAQKILCWRLEGYWRKWQDPDPSIRDTDPRIRIRTKMSRIRTHCKQVLSSFTFVVPRKVNGLVMVLTSASNSASASLFTSWLGVSLSWLYRSFPPRTSEKSKWIVKNVNKFFYLPQPLLFKCKVVTPQTSVADPEDPYVLGLLDPDPDPLVRGIDPDPSIIKQKKEKKPWFQLFWDIFMTFYLWQIV